MSTVIAILLIYINHYITVIQNNSINVSCESEALYGDFMGQNYIFKIFAFGAL